MPAADFPRFFSDAAWFQASGDLIFAQWLLDRCTDLSDVETPLSLEACKRAFAWFLTRKRIRLELGIVNTEADTDESCPHPLWAIRPPMWSVGEIVEDVGGELRTLRREMATLGSDSEVGSLLEKATVAEVVETATELLASRATIHDGAELRKWTELLEGEDAEFGSGPWLWEGKARDAAVAAREQLAVSVKVLAELPTIDGDQAVDVPTVDLEVASMWPQEMQRLEKINSQEVANRRKVANDIEYMVHGTWPGCKVEVYGSSLSLYGSSDSDVDMTLMTNKQRRRGKDLPAELLGFYFLKRLMDRKVWDEEERGNAMTPDVEQMKRARKQVRQAIGGLDTCEDPREAAYFELHMELLVTAMSREIDDLYRKARSRGVFIESSWNASKDSVLYESKNRKNELFDLKSILEAEPEIQIQSLASHARVPVIRFQYTQGGLDYKCDLCFDNELGLRNTRLLRAYASYDERARDLGLAVKFWAKQRGISDTASGFLSSYSYVLLSIYYLQLVHVLPNLQDPRLLELAGVSPEYYDNMNIAFCEDRDIAAVFHEQTSADADSQDASIPELLLGFFKFYATQFDYVKHAVAIRTPERSVSKQSLWGTKAKSWRMSIQDPLQTSRDLGGMLHFSSQGKISQEMRRAHELLLQRESFLDMVC